MSDPDNYDIMDAHDRATASGSNVSNINILSEGADSADYMDVREPTSSNHAGDSGVVEAVAAYKLFTSGSAASNSSGYTGTESPSQTEASNADSGTGYSSGYKAKRTAAKPKRGFWHYAALAVCGYAVFKAGEWGYDKYNENHKVKPKSFVEEVDLTNSNKLVRIKKGCGGKVYSRVGNKIIRNPQPDGMVMATLWEIKDGGKIIVECDKGSGKYTLRMNSNDIEAASAQAKWPGFIDPALKKTSRSIFPQP